MNRFLSSPWTKVAVFLLALVPLGVLLWWCWEAYQSVDPTPYVSANPIDSLDWPDFVGALRAEESAVTSAPPADDVGNG